MKKIILPFILIIIITTLLGFRLTPSVATTLKGSWKAGSSVLICSDKYFSVAYFDIAKKRFDGTIGGTYSINGSDITFAVEYSYPDKSLVGQAETVPFTMSNGTFTYDGSQGTVKYDKIGEAGASPLAALWQITGREDKNGAMGEIKKAARKTIKLLTDDRFQWAAINTETGEFFGTGGGTYTLKDGKYTESIEFFSRDSSRVGMSLTFDAQVDAAKWQHTGKSSKGDKVNEVWEKQ
jgi:hypothetical protein